MKIKRIKIRGHSKRAYGLVFVLVFAIAGAGYLLYSHAEVGISVTDTTLPMESFTSPSVGGEGIAYQERSRRWLRYHDYRMPSQSVATTKPMMAGTSPSISGSYIAFQADTGYLQFYNTQTGQTVDTSQLMRSDSSPSISANYIAFQTNTGVLSYYNTLTAKITNTAQPMPAGASPSISGNYIIYKSATTNSLQKLDITTGQSVNTGIYLREGTNPSISPSVVAYQSTSGRLAYYRYTVSGSGETLTSQLLLPGTNPSISGNLIAFFASTGALKYLDVTTNQVRETGLNGIPGSGPNISGNTIAFLGTNGTLWYYKVPSLPPPATVSLSGPIAVNQGQGAILKYTTTNTNSCTMDGVTFNPTQSIDGSYSINSITATTTYTITCTGLDSNKVSAYWTVKATGAPSGTITGPSVVEIGQLPVLTISTVNVSNCKVNDVSVSPNGTYIASEILTYTTYELKCGGADGTGTALLAYTGVGVVGKDYGPKRGLPENGADGGQSAHTAETMFGADYHWVTGEVKSKGLTGVSASILTSKPRVTDSMTGAHSLAQIGITNFPKSDKEKQNGVEFGWIVGNTSNRRNEDTQPRLFVYSDIDKYSDHGCYNTNCEGFVLTSKVIKLGMPLVVGSVHNYKASYSSNTDRWYLFFDGNEVGYYPNSLFKKHTGADFREANHAAAWGEVAFHGKCIEMGNGRKGTTTQSAYIKNVKTKYSGMGWGTIKFDKIWNDKPNNFNYGKPKVDSFSFGGRDGSDC